MYHPTSLYYYLNATGCKTILNNTTEKRLQMADINSNSDRARKENNTNANPSNRFSFHRLFVNLANLGTFEPPSFDGANFLMALLTGQTFQHVPNDTTSMGAMTTGPTTTGPTATCKQQQVQEQLVQQ
jgi:hypothetical protein